MLGHMRLGRETRPPVTPCVMLPTNPAPYTIVEWGIQTARYNMYTHIHVYIQACIGLHTHTRTHPHPHTYTYTVFEMRGGGAGGLTPPCLHRTLAFVLSKRTQGGSLKDPPPPPQISKCLL